MFVRAIGEYTEEMTKERFWKSLSKEETVAFGCELAAKYLNSIHRIDFLEDDIDYHHRHDNF